MGVRVLLLTLVFWSINSLAQFAPPNGWNGGESVVSQPQSTGATGESKLEETEIREGINDQENYYLGINLGISNVPGADNVRASNGAAGFGLGIALPYGFWIEPSFLYSLQQVDGPSKAEDVDLFALSMAGTYHWTLEGARWLTPITGIAMTYTRRTYNAGDNGESNGFDVGAVLGADVSLNPSVSLGLEYRFMTNVAYERTGGKSPVDQAINQILNGPTRDLEDFVYQMVLLNTKIQF